ncbi:hypothetical protein [Chryseobacterium taiwanense]|uniref:Uncharacterized protein n=1 Tax=Chryseobacterium taiwanense TaxID=363331 RepID=A0A0B4DHN3_9FLAO|nr:hypothetical protein [Chryseobacterium taiwanense]KIC63960.1 hypothetical protein RM51_04315 [Chryseobacterium taiwanense]
MKKISLLILLISLLNCKKQTFDEFDFSFGNTFETDFSIKFDSKNDSVYIRENWSSFQNKTTKSETNYLAVLNTSQKIKLDSFVESINFKTLDTLYFERYSDGEYYNFHIKKDGIEKTIKTHSHSIPKSLEKFAYWIYETKKSLKLTETKRNFDFKSKNNFPEPPEAP